MTHSIPEGKYGFNKPLNIVTFFNYYDDFGGNGIYDYYRVFIRTYSSEV